jgi:hypothetical protein
MMRSDVSFSYSLAVHSCMGVQAHPVPGDVRDATSMCLITDSTTSANREVPGFQGRSRQSLPSAFAPATAGVTKTQGWYFGYISISAATVTPYSHPARENKTSKPKERHLRKRLKERKVLFDESTLLAPTLQRQSSTPHTIVVFRQTFLPGNIFAKITRITSGRYSPAESSSV